MGKFLLKILVSDKDKNRFKATTSLSKLNEKPKNIRRDLAYLEEDYSLLVKMMRDTMSAFSRGKRMDPRLYWLAGDNIIRFLDRVDDMGFCLTDENYTFARDIGVSTTSIWRIISFRKRFPKLSMVNPQIPWSKHMHKNVPVASTSKRLSLSQKELSTFALHLDRDPVLKKLWDNKKDATYDKL